MNFEIEIVVEPAFLRIKTTGKYAFEDLFGFLGQVKTEVEQAEKKRVLIDSRLLVGNMSEAERFQGGQKIAELFGSRIKVALMMPAEQVTKLGELAAANRGAKFLVTPDEKEALTWLLSD